MIGCKEKVVSEIDWAPFTDSLKGERLLKDTSILADFWYPSMYKGWVIAGQLNHSPAFRLCRITEDSIVSAGEFLTIGDGPYEMHFPQCAWNFYDNYLFIGDFVNRQNKLIYIPLDSIQNVFDVHTWEVSKFVPFVLEGHRISPSSLICLEKGKFVDAMIAGKVFVFIDNNQDTLWSGGEYPDDGCNVLPKRLKSYAYLGDWQKHPREDKFVYFSSYNRYMFITKLEGDTMKEIASPYRLYPQYSLSEDGQNVSIDAQCYFGVRKMYVTENYIYMLMNDALFGDFKKGKMHDGYSVFYSNEVYVFDWEGRPVKKYRLDHQVGNIWTDENDECLYASTIDPEDPEGEVIYLRYRMK